MIYTEIETIIVELLERSAYTFEGLKAALETGIEGEINTRDLTEILWSMTIDEKIALLSNGAASAYFIADRLPVRFYLGAGCGRVNAHYEGENHGPPLTFAPVRRIEKPERSKDYPILGNFTESELKVISQMIAADAPYEEVAAALQVAVELFKRRARRDPKTKSAIAAGRREAEKAARLKAESTVFYNLGVAGMTNRDLLSKLGLTVHEFGRKLNTYPILREALEAGRAAFCQKTPAPEPPDGKSKINEEPPAPRVLSWKRLCACGRPLGARANECRDCWMLGRDKNKPVEKIKTAADEAAQKTIEELLLNTTLDREELLKIALSTIMKFPVTALKERFAVNLFDASRRAVGDLEQETD